jgi:hypothetical protein
MDAGDAGALLLPLDLNIEITVFAVRLVELASLVSFGQVRIEIVLARKDTALVHGEVESESGPNCELERLFVEYGERPRKPQTHRANLSIRLTAEFSGAAAK